MPKGAKKAVLVLVLTVDEFMSLIEEC